jgi:hypothetical protein
MSDEEYRPPSIADGTVDPSLIRNLNKLVDEFGYAGVKSTLEELTDGGLLGYMGTDAQRWAQEFCVMHGGDEGLVIGWFANAIEAGRSAQLRAAPDEVLDEVATNYFLYADRQFKRNTSEATHLWLDARHRMRAEDEEYD